MFVNRFFLIIIVMMITNLTYSQHTSIQQYLNGRVSGLRVSSLSGTPGTMSQMRIRGEGSYSLSNEPLIVIDGLPFFNARGGRTAPFLKASIIVKSSPELLS